MSAEPVTETDIITTLKSIRDYIRWGASQFAENKVFLGHGIATSLHESAALVMHALYQPYHLDDCYLDAVLTLDERRKVMHLLERRIKERKPVAYLTNEAIFAGLSFYVDERVLVPRSP
ncbi:MAG: 50S ribosomal protein L3 N(5)-glutamine methyltransferase, partial [Methylococcales bacterium]|nr:50S ribosomal protein L3 N(5)-glutamine methyltransferase [Methylococcales bacterium]